jgi:uncharacterized membrane protein
MTVLIWGMVLFFGAHLLSLTPARAPLHAKLGEKAYKGIYSIVSLVGLGLMIWGFGLARSALMLRVLCTTRSWAPATAPCCWSSWQ